MKACLPAQGFCTLQDLETLWRVTPTRLKHWITAGQLQSHVWLPVMSVFRLSGDNTHRLCHWEGYAGVSRHSCYRLFRSGKIHIRDFKCHASGYHYKLPDTADSLMITQNDLIILADDKQAFEASYGLADAASGDEVAFDPSFKTIALNGHRADDSGTETINVGLVINEIM